MPSQAEDRPAHRAETHAPGGLAARGELAGQVALVTGATRGIGRAIAMAFAQSGARVIGTATTDEGATTIGADLHPIDGLAEGVRLDGRDAAAIEAVLKGIERRHGSIGILVNNAGITRDNLLVRMKEDDWDAIMAINLKPAFQLAKAVVRGMMKARHGRIIQIGSVVGTSGNPGQTNYAAAKAALVGFTKSLALEVGSRDITVNCVAPGFIDTDMTQAMAQSQRDALLARIPLGRLGAPEDVAHAVLFLAGPRAGYITGTTLHVNGGMLMP
jgi:3-oxoacyl-[acyl-carrier protein] reductase